MRNPLLLLFFAWSATACSSVTDATEVSYAADGVQLEGYLVWNTEQQGPRPGVLVVHEWWGHNDYARRRARELAEAGYTAFAIDMYGDGKRASHPSDAAQFSSEVMSDMAGAEARFRAAHDLLRAHATTDPERIAAIGYCFGGAICLQMARAGVDLDGVASFHGMLGTANPAEPGQVKAKVLVLHGADDQFVPPAQVDALREEMRAAGVDCVIKEYPGASHGFTNPAADALGEEFDLPLRYDPIADAASWAALHEFFGRIF